jgi:hypothetical protein
VLLFFLLVAPLAVDFFVAFFALFFLGTFAPLALASDSPIAMACLRLFTVPPFPPFPLLSVPFFLQRIALSTVF